MLVSLPHMRLSIPVTMPTRLWRSPRRMHRGSGNEASQSPRRAPKQIGGRIHIPGLQTNDLRRNKELIQRAVPLLGHRTARGEPIYHLRVAGVSAITNG
jgi:hypothetical protein